MRLILPALALLLLPSISLAQQVTPQDGIIAVLKQQRNLFLDWHAESAARADALTIEVARLQAKLADLEKKSTASEPKTEAPKE